MRQSMKTISPTIRRGRRATGIKDGDFDSSDFVAAFVDGGYEKGPREGINIVPESSSNILGLAGLIADHSDNAPEVTTGTASHVPGE